MTLIDLLKLIPDEERVVIFENPRKNFPVNGTVEEIMDEATEELLETPITEIRHSVLYEAVWIELERN